MDHDHGGGIGTSARRLSSFALALALASLGSCGLVAMACGGSSLGDHPADAADAADAASEAATAADATSELDVSVATPRCPGATYSAAPSGAACDPTRILQTRGLAGSCAGPPVGTFCADLQISVKVADEGALPAGFVCGSPELGVATCLWSFGDDAGSVHMLDTAALEAACAATVSLPTTDVTCLNYGD